MHPQFDVSGPFGVYTGEIEIAKTSGYYYDKDKGEYTNNSQLMMKWMKTDMTMWINYYKFLGAINLVVLDITTAKGNNENLRNYVKGEALVWRAYSYFKLLQYYAPYKDDKYGIPVHLNPYDAIETVMPKRLTQTEVYARIIGDCKEALALMDVTPSTPWNCAYTYDFVNSMLSSIYLYKAMSGAAESDDWQNAANAATEGMRGRKLTSEYNVLTQMFNCNSSVLVADYKSDEFSFRIMDGSNIQFCNLLSSYKKGDLNSGTPTKEYSSLFVPGDWRSNFYLNDKYGLWASVPGGIVLPYRLAEVVLNKAEALVRMGDVAGSTAALQEFIDSRYYDTKPIITGGQEEVLQLILDERKREFYLENDVRWLDMKRTGVTVTRVINGETFTLKSDDFRYACPIPDYEMRRNKNMVQNPGWENIIIIDKE